MKKSFFEHKNIIVSLHILAWVILLGLPLYFVKRWEIGKDFVWLYYINVIINGIIFYTNYFYLVSKFFFEGRKYRYYLSIAILLFIFYFVSDKSNQAVFRFIPDGRRHESPPHEYVQEKRPAPQGSSLRIPMRPPFRQMHMFNYGFTAISLIFFSLGLRVIERHVSIEKIQKELERQKLNSELAFLKNQISPHFFFNTLNNIYSLISINAEDSQKAVLKLSKMMRYLLYESEHGDTKLGSELEFMTNYIDLMKLRMSDKVKLSVDFPESYEDISIPPLLFIPFIENAFKHGLSFRENSFIGIKMTCTGNEILFSCVNSIAIRGNGSVEETSGIGLENVTKRLELLFPGSYDLKFTKKGETFEVLLKIELKA
jgi:two-component system, LytTR family, sensor kinase